jgi:hypothetical protein
MLVHLLGYSLSLKANWRQRKYLIIHSRRWSIWVVSNAHSKFWARCGCADNCAFTFNSRLLNSVIRTIKHCLSFIKYTWLWYLVLSTYRKLRTPRRLNCNVFIAKFFPVTCVLECATVSSAFLFVICNRRT